MDVYIPDLSYGTLTVKSGAGRVVSEKEEYALRTKQVVDRAHALCRSLPLLGINALGIYIYLK